MDVGGWLRSLGLGQYEANFRDNKIDADVLPQLTADDLKDIGVSAVGDRRRLLAAIAALSGPTPSANAPASSPKPAPAKGLETSAERRPITVMFCDLVGSTSLAAKLDAEDFRNLVNAYLDRALAAVTDFGGHVLKKLGDGLMALFGYPQAQENDAERAVRAALAIQRALSEHNARNAGRDAPSGASAAQAPPRVPAIDRPHRHRMRLGRGRRGRRSVRRGAERRGAGAGGSRAGDSARHRERAAADGRAFRRRGQGRA